MTNAPTMPPPARMQLNIISEVALSSTGEARPIHILRTGTFTSGNGYTFTFEREHLEAIEQSFATNGRKRPPITECHDYGRAVGRITKVWVEGDSLYAQPKWNKAGAQLLIDEVYDGFSCEVANLSSTPTLIGGSLTNYPAVDGLEAVTLSMPPVSLPSAVEETQVLEDTPPPSPTAPLAAGGQRVNTQHTKEIPRMSEELDTTQQAPPADALPPIQPPQFTAADPAVQAQVNAVVAQMTAQFESQRQIVLEQAQAQFQRQLAEMQARQQIETYAQHVTTPTMQRQHALPFEASAVVAFLSGLNPTQRTQAQGFFDKLLESGLVSFEEIGSQAEGTAEQSAKERFDAAVQAKVAGGMSQYAAMQAVGKEQPALYQEYANESSRRGAVQVKKGGK